MREKARGISSRAEPAAEDLFETHGQQPLACEQIKIGLPPTACVTHECAGRPRVVCEERRAHLMAHLERGGPDRRAEPCDEPVRGLAKRTHGGLEHTRGQAAPSRMRSRDAAAVAMRDEYPAHGRPRAKTST